ncbi:sulfotransferase family protein [Cystobacter ferrugineus]|uniref:Sulfotransferase n=1 Tax=Cystobacter ferrugineus TaxID=83449 RepID=A0A1L9BFD3_9BACT|nr:sulfotransferase [Cystobacter ferrugineus]OJH40967.1 sulfotransferase [Cystobacter ferrugineus]
MRKPNFFIVGAPRCATTTVYTYLKQHPDIFLSLLKEPLFFGSDLTPHPLAISDEAAYLRLFAGAGEARVIGEGSVFYWMSKRAAEEIHAWSPEARILIMLRDPVEMMQSLHALFLRTGNEELEDFARALEAEAARAQGQRLPARVYFPEGLQYRALARFSEAVERFLRVFGEQRVHVLLFEELTSDPKRAMRGLLDFLEVDPDVPLEFDPVRAAQCIRPLVLRQMRAASPEVLEKLERKTARNLHHGPRGAPLPPELETRLREELRPDGERLEARLGRPLSGWYRPRAA